MKFEDKEIKTKDGRTCLLTPATEEYAAVLIEYLKVSAGESNFLLRSVGEVNYTIESEKEILNRFYNSPNDVMILAFVDGKLAGNCAFSCIGKGRKVKHRCSLGIALLKEYWNLGIGSAMLEYSCELAKEVGYEQMELGVIQGNERGKHLYEKLGFIESGKIVDAVKFDDGTYADEILMYKKLI